MLQILRLGFHDCLKYSDGLGEDEVNGCDGCLNPEGMGLDMLRDFNTDKFKFNGPDVNVTNNNGLTHTADVLEEIYTNKDFPPIYGMPSLPQSMKDSGKSRADLWAFATLMAVQYGIWNNNEACRGNFK